MLFTSSGTQLHSQGLLHAFFQPLLMPQGHEQLTTPPGLCVIQHHLGICTLCLIQFPNDAGLDTRCKFPDDAGIHTSQVESSVVRVLVALVKSERKRAPALENVAEFLKKRKEQSDAIFAHAKEEMEEARIKLA